MSIEFDRFKILKISDVMPLLNNCDSKIEVSGLKVDIDNINLVAFETRGLRCVNCGLKGSFFALERKIHGSYPLISPESRGAYELNLYGAKSQGSEEIRMVSRIGSGGILQPICSSCN